MNSYTTNAHTKARSTTTNVITQDSFTTDTITTYDSTTDSVKIDRTSPTDSFGRTSPSLGTGGTPPIGQGETSTAMVSESRSVVSTKATTFTGPVSRGILTTLSSQEASTTSPSATTPSTPSTVTIKATTKASSSAASNTGINIHSSSTTWVSGTPSKAIMGSTIPSVATSNKSTGKGTTTPPLNRTLQVIIYL